MNPDIQLQINNLNRRLDQMESSSSLSRNVETAFKERLGFKFIPTIVTGIDTPTITKSIPLKVGDIYIDTVNLKVYVSVNNTAVGDYKILN